MGGATTNTPSSVTPSTSRSPRVNKRSCLKQDSQPPVTSAPQESESQPPVTAAPPKSESMRSVTLALPVEEEYINSTSLRNVEVYMLNHLTKCACALFLLIEWLQNVGSDQH